MMIQARLLCIFVHLVSFSFVLCSDNELFVSGNTLYAERDFTRALEQYQQIAKKESSVWYNMGNCHYKQNQELKAYACWQRALRQGSGANFDACITHCALVEQKLGMPTTSPWWYLLWYKPSVLVMQLLFLFFWYILLFYGAEIVIKKRYYLFSFLLLCSVVIGSWLIVKYTMDVGKKGFIQETTACYVGPSEKYFAQATLHPTESVSVCQEADQWLKVKTATGKGWIKKEALLII